MWTKRRFSLESALHTTYGVVGPASIVCIFFFVFVTSLILHGLCLVFSFCIFQIWMGACWMWNLFSLSLCLTLSF